MKTLAYFDGGNTYKYCFERTPAEIGALKDAARLSSHVGYLYGHRCFDGQTDKVYCFFKEKPTREEIARRQRNGFVGARWNEL